MRNKDRDPACVCDQGACVPSAQGTVARAQAREDLVLGRGEHTDFSECDEKPLFVHGNHRQ